MTPFTSLGLSQNILRALSDEGYATPTPIQAQTIPPALEGRDVLGCAQTGTGKTAAFALPVIHSLFEEGRDKSRRGAVLPRALVLSPTRELASQIGDSFRAYSRHTGVSGTIIFGGVSQRRQVQALERGVDVVVATPGRLIDLLDQGLVDLSAVRILVLDEADRMLDMGFIHPIRRIASLLREDRQTLLFSATMPKEIKRLADSLMTDPVRVAVTPVASAAPLIDQSVYMVQKARKAALLEHLLADGAIERALVFTRTKHGAERLMKSLNRSGHAADSIHGNKSQNQRERALAGFRSGRARVLVATDVAARGLDVDGVTHVFNFDLPVEPEAYVHRIGRTGRAGAKGSAISFCDGEERAHLRSIEKLIGKQIESVNMMPAMQPAERPESRPSAPHQGRPSGGAPTRDRRPQQPGRTQQRRNGEPAGHGAPRHGGANHNTSSHGAPNHGGANRAGPNHGGGGTHTMAASSGTRRKRITRRGPGGRPQR